jgi:hypothetical protein
MIMSKNILIIEIFVSDNPNKYQSRHPANSSIVLNNEQ